MATIEASPLTGVALRVERAVPRIAWTPPVPIVYGTALSAGQLAAAADVPGTLTYAPGSGAVLGAGEHVLSVHLVPDDAAPTGTETRPALPDGASRH